MVRLFREWVNAPIEERLKKMEEVHKERNELIDDLHKRADEIETRVKTIEIEQGICPPEEPEKV